MGGMVLEAQGQSGRCRSGTVVVAVSGVGLVRYGKRKPQGAVEVQAESGPHRRVAWVRYLRWVSTFDRVGGYQDCTKTDVDAVSGRAPPRCHNQVSSSGSTYG